MTPQERQNIDTIVNAFIDLSAQKYTMAYVAGYLGSVVGRMLELVPEADRQDQLLQFESAIERLSTEELV